MDESFDPNATPRGIDDPGTAATGPTRMIPALAVVRITPAHWNPRKVYDPAKTEELAAGIRVRGILEPLVVRPRERDGVEGYEIVCGERRYRAAMLAGLLHVPAVVRELDDREALECAVSENGDREPLHPLEEADAFITLHMTYNESAEDIATRFGVTVRLVHQRLSLAALCQEGRDAFREGVLSWGSALRIARLSSQDYQREAVEWVKVQRALRMAHGGDPGVSATEAGRWIVWRYHLRLDRAPFDVADGALLAGVGPCGTCPKNTDAQRALFEEELGFAECTDPVCFSRKKEASWQRVAAAHVEAAGRPLDVLTAEQSAAVAPQCHGGPPSKGYVLPDEKPGEYGGRRTWLQLLGVNTPAPVVARNHDGSPVELIAPDALRAAVKAAGLAKLTKAGGKGGAKAESKGGAAKVRASIGDEDEVGRKIRETLVEAARAAQAKSARPLDDRALWQFVTGSFIVMNGDYAFTPEFKERFKGLNARNWAARVLDEVSHLSATGCRALLIDAAVDAAIRDEMQDAGTVIWPFLGIDPEAIEQRVRAEIEAAKPAPAPKKGAKGKATKPAAKKTAKKGGR